MKFLVIVIILILATMFSIYGREFDSLFQLVIWSFALVGIAKVICWQSDKEKENSEQPKLPDDFYQNQRWY